jgi:hypothetical protein
VRSAGDLVVFGVGVAQLAEAAIAQVGQQEARPAIDTYRAGGGRAADGMRQAGGFGEPEEWLADWARPYTRDEWLDLVPTLGGFPQIPPDVQAELLAGLGAAVDAAGGAFTMGYTTLAVTAVRLAR